MKRRAERLAYDLEQIEEEMADAPGSVAPPPNPTGGPARERHVLVRMAAHGVSTLDIKRLPDDSGVVRLDGRKGFRVPPAVADLLEILAAGSGDQEAENSFVAWKSYDHVLRLLSKHSGRPTSRHAALQLVFRLKSHLRHAGENPFLVQVNRRRKAMRFALRLGAQD